MFELIYNVVLGSGVLVMLWYALRQKEYRMLLMAGFALSVLFHGVVLERSWQGLASRAAVNTSHEVMYAGFALQYAYFFLQLRDYYRKSVAEYNARALRQTS